MTKKTESTVGMTNTTLASTNAYEHKDEGKSINEDGQPVVEKTKSMTCDSIVEYNSDVKGQTSERGKCAIEKKTVHTDGKRVH